MNIIINKFLLLVGISETIRTQKKIIMGYNKKFLIKNYIAKRKMSTGIVKDIIKDNHNNEISLKFKQWFAGLTDGDGYIYVNKQGYIGFELTLPSCDEKVLRIIQNKFGGNIKPRSGVKAVRYRTQNKQSIIKIINCLNGLIINNVRLIQLHKACLALNIPIKDPITPTIDSAYVSGLLDSDGSINIYKHYYNDTYRYQLTISIANKSRSNIEFLLNIIGGNIYFDKSDNGRYIWKANSKLLFIAFCFEYENYNNSLLSNETTYTSYFPIQLDATCNGYQHLSLLTGDEPLATQLNLTLDNNNSISNNSLFMLISNLTKKIPNCLKLFFRLLLLSILVIKLLGFSVIEILNSTYYIKIYLYVSCSLVIIYQLSNLYLLHKFSKQNVQIPKVLPEFIINWLNEFNVISSSVESIKEFKKTYYKEISLYLLIIIIITLML